MPSPRILYTYTDEAPALASYSLLPIVQAFARAGGVVVDTRDISLAGRILASFPDDLPAERRRPDDLTELGKVAGTPHANIIKLPNISASLPQLKRALPSCSARATRCRNIPTIRRRKQSAMCARATTA